MSPDQAVEVLKSAGYFGSSDPRRGGAIRGQEEEAPTTLYLAGGDHHQLWSFESVGYAAKEKMGILRQGLERGGAGRSRDNHGQQRRLSTLEYFRHHASVGAFIDAVSSDKNPRCSSIVAIDFGFFD